MQENKIRLNSFLAIPKRVAKHGTAVKAVEEQQNLLELKMTNCE